MQSYAVFIYLSFWSGASLVLVVGQAVVAASSAAIQYMCEKFLTHVLYPLKGSHLGLVEVLCHHARGRAGLHAKQ